MNKFKVGDRVEYCGGSLYNFGGSLGKAEKGMTYTISSIDVGCSGEAIYGVSGSYEGKPNWCHMEKNFNLVTKKSTMKTVTNTFKLFTDKKTQTLRKAEYIDGDLELTEKGQNALDSILLGVNKDALVALAEEDIKENK